MQQPTRPLFALFGVFMLIFALVGAAFAGPLAARVDHHAPFEASDGDGSLLFIENVGQFPAGARFQVWGSTESLWLAEDALWLTLAAPEPSRALRDDAMPASSAETAIRQGVALRLSFPGANPHPQIETFGRQASQISYFIGSDPARWHAAVPIWQGVRYVDLYPGVNLEITSERGAWTWAFVRTGANEAADSRNLAASLRVEGVNTVTAADMSGTGSENTLRLDTAGGPVSLPLPRADFGYRMTVMPTAGDALALAVPPATRPGAARAAAPADNPSSLVFSTYLGGSTYDFGRAIAVDQAGNVYVAGATSSADFPTRPGAYDSSYNGEQDAFVAKLNPAGTDLIYATYLGGSELEEAYALAVDDAGQAFIAGATRSSNFPTTSGAYSVTHGGGACSWGSSSLPCRDAFVVKLNPTGSQLVYATFLGGNSDDVAYDIALGEDSSAYVTGDAEPGFPVTPGAINRGSPWGAFVTRLDADGHSLVYSALLSGQDGAKGRGITVDPGGNAFIVGHTWSEDFPTTAGAFQPTAPNELNIYWNPIPFVTKLTADGSNLTYSTFLAGTTGGGDAYDIAVDGAGNAYITGETGASDFPTTPGAFDRIPGGYVDAFVSKLNPAGSSLVYSTYLGGSGTDKGFGLAVDATGNVYVTGRTESASDFPVTADALYTRYRSGDCDLFVAMLDSAGSRLPYGTFLGGDDDDCDWHFVGLSNSAITVAGSNRVYVTGGTYSDDFPTTAGALKTARTAVWQNAFVTALQLAESPVVTPGPPRRPAQIAVAPTSWDFGDVPAGMVQAKTISVQNSGEMQLRIGAVSTPAPPFAITTDGCSNRTLQEAGSCAIIAQFAPPRGSGSVPGAPPSFVRESCSGCLVTSNHYSSGFLTGFTAYFYVKNVGGSGSADVAAGSNGFSGSQQPSVAGGARYTVEADFSAYRTGTSTVWATLPGFSSNSPTSALASGAPSIVLKRKPEGIFVISSNSGDFQVNLYGTALLVTPTPVRSYLPLLLR
ncbi:MAG: SBBP repeat-containing protein [Chloroflexi bacterium]|nr:SBBP repeat-containing protein [Chloroflexota bacterium]